MIASEYNMRWIGGQTWRLSCICSKVVQMCRCQIFAATASVQALVLERRHDLRLVIHGIQTLYSYRLLSFSLVEFRWIVVHSNLKFGDLRDLICVLLCKDHLYSCVQVYLCRQEGLAHKVLQWYMCRMEGWFAADAYNISVQSWDEVLWRLLVSLGLSSL